MSAAAQPPLDAEAPPVVETPPPAGPDMSALQRQIDELKASAEESTRAIQFWHDKATAVEKPPAAGDEDDPDILDIITAKGAKGLDELLDKHAAKRGYVKKEELDSTLATARDTQSVEIQLVRDYPDLADHDSAFFKDVAAEYGKLHGPPAKGGEGLSERVAMRIAAERVDLRWLRTGKSETPAQVAEKTKAAKEKERKERIAAQAGDRGTRASAAEEDDDEVTPEERRIAINIIKEDGMTDEQAIEKYKARAKKGVALRGIPRR